jgi:hypothetical protein
MNRITHGPTSSFVDFSWKYPQNANMEKIASPIRQVDQETNHEIEERG